MKWKHPSSQKAKKFKAQPSAEKRHAYALLELGRACTWTLPSERSNSEQWRLLCSFNRRSKPVIRTKRRGQLSQNLILQHENVRPHAANKTLETIRNLKFVLLEYPPYSPDLAPRNFHVFGPLKLRLERLLFRNTRKWKMRAFVFANAKQNFYPPELQTWLNVGPSALMGEGGGG
jgi:hypothetical protein